MMPSQSSTTQSAGAAYPELSIIVPVYNEQAMVERFMEELRPVLQSLRMSYEVIFVNDGSTDLTLQALERLRAADATTKIVDLSRNFGKEIAISAGLDYCRGDAVIPIDADLQDPPEIIPQMIAKWREGYEVVLAVRADRSSDSRMKRLTSDLFYRIFNAVAESPIPEHAGDFRLMDKKVVRILRLFPERNRFMKGMFNWPGFRQVSVYFDRRARPDGKSKWNYWRLTNFALDAVFSFSVAPLRIWSVIGILCSLAAFVAGMFLIVNKLVSGIDVPGYPSLMVVLLFMGGLQLFCLGILGEYIGRIYKETKGRPLYVVHRTIGIEPFPELPRERWPLIVEA